MDKDINSGLKGCLIIFFVVGIILSYCFQCSYDRKIEEQERRTKEYLQSPRTIAPIRAPGTYRTTPPSNPQKQPIKEQENSEQTPWQAAGYDSFEDWYYAEMDVIGIGEYPDM